MRTGMQKPLIVAGIVAAVGAASLAAGSAVVNAESQSVNGSGQKTSLVRAIAERFKLKESDVQNVFDEQRAAMESSRDQELKDRIAELVKNNKLTKDQGDKLIAKRTELSQQRTENQSTDRAERQAERQEHRAAINQWLSDNGIDSQYSYLLGMGGHKGGTGHGMNR